MTKHKLNPKQTTQEKEPLALFPPFLSLLFATLFTPIFGAFLHGLNWKALGEDELAAQSMNWVRWCFYVVVIYTFAEPFIDETLIGRYLMIGLFVGMWIGWVLSIGWRQVRFVKDYYDGKYERKRLGKAIMLGGFGWVAYVAVALTLVLFLHVIGVEPLPADAPILQQ